ncbi:helix-turn-helix domain-containing protein [Cohnella abietis]|uniref:helix-turn-helix domain-containing protein n=1 Tax=Cohnella abietis TaxID=2507935 RepID=UPI00138FA1D1|nr:helix-turn-helix domain-containing protein [Cohnella abietis]
MSEILEITHSRHLLVVCRDGSGLLWAGGMEYELELGKCFIFKPDTALQISNASEYPLSAYLLEFNALTLSANRGQPSPLLEGGEFRVIPFTRLIDLARSLYENKEVEGEAGEYGNHALFQEIVHLVWQSEMKDKDDDATQSVKRTIEYMKESYTLDLTHSQLAEMAGLSLRHYSRLFLKLTGKSPIEFLIEQRLNRARQLLLTSRDTIQEIAGSVGFRDPFHFSRSFKKHMNVSPRLYIHLRKNNIRVISMQFLGEMLTLGIKPVGAPGLLLQGGFLGEKVDGIQEVSPSVINPEMDRLEALKPDAILTFDGHHYESYSRIAPTLSVPWSLPWFERFRRLAEWIGKSEEAEHWISAYYRQVEEVKEQLMQRLVGQPTVSFFWSRGLPQTLQVYYDMAVFYRDLGMKAPPSVSRIQGLEGHPFKANIPVEEIADYAGDHLFIVVSRDQDSLRAMQQLENTKEWKSLPAVQKRQVYQVSDDWLMEDPISRLGQLRSAVQFMKP